MAEYTASPPRADFVQFTGTNLAEALAHLGAGSRIVVLYDEYQAPWIGSRPTNGELPIAMFPLPVGTWLAWDPDERLGRGMLIRAADDNGRPAGFTAA